MWKIALPAAVSGSKRWGWWLDNLNISVSCLFTQVSHPHCMGSFLTSHSSVAKTEFCTQRFCINAEDIKVANRCKFGLWLFQIFTCLTWNYFNRVLVPEDLDEAFLDQKWNFKVTLSQVLLFTMTSLAQERGSSFEFGVPTHKIFVSICESTLWWVRLGGISLKVWEKGQEIFYSICYVLSLPIRAMMFIMMVG